MFQWIAGHVHHLRDGDPLYLFDFVIYSPTLEQHVEDVDEVLAILGERKLFAKEQKCEFGRQELGFLGHRVSAEGIKVDPRKVQAIRKWPVPGSCAEVRRFCGLANYYRRFVPTYSEVAARHGMIASARTYLCYYNRTEAPRGLTSGLAPTGAGHLYTFHTSRLVILLILGGQTDHPRTRISGPCELSQSYRDVGRGLPSLYVRFKLGGAAAAAAGLTSFISFPDNTR